MLALNHRSRLVLLLAIFSLGLLYFLASTTSYENAKPTLLVGVGPPKIILPSASKLEHNPPPTVRPATTQPEPTGICAERYGKAYIDAFTHRAAQYCDSDSTSSLTCFTHKAHDQRTDSFCVGGPAAFDSGQQTVGLKCTLRQLTTDNRQNHVPSLSSFPAYWYSTGPQAIFRKTVKFEDGSSQDALASQEARGFSFLVKREDNHSNLWHTMMEIMSLTFSLDVLRAAKNPVTGKPFLTNADVEHSQVVLLDDLADGPFIDAWRFASGLPTKRINETNNNSLTNIVVPLPGGSNPFWEGDWEDIDCGESSLLQTFSDRILDFHSIITAPGQGEKPLTLTYIDRHDKRRLLNKEQYLETLRARYIGLHIRVVDFANMAFAEQLKIAHTTDILVGVHGAGLTHGMFLPPQSTIVEILPPKFDHRGFANLARFLGHRYFGRHASEREGPEKTGNWQQDDVLMEEEQFLQVVGDAIAATGS